MEDKKQYAKDIFKYKGIYFVKNIISREKIKQIETSRLNTALKENKKYMTLYASKDGVIAIEHDCIEDAISSIKTNTGYERQLWAYNEEKGAYEYAAEFKADENTKI